MNPKNYINFSNSLDDLLILTMGYNLQKKKKKKKKN